MDLSIRHLQAIDAATIAESFDTQHWNKPVEQYERYYREQEAGDRVVLVAWVSGIFCGYINILWRSHYPPFCEAGIPELADFNVLIAYQRQGIGSCLMDEAELVARERSAIVGIGVGMTADYGPAQQLYVRRGYIPDGRGLMYANRTPVYGERVPFDDDLVLYFTKDFRRDDDIHVSEGKEHPHRSHSCEDCIV